jgi:putative redox protein
LAWFLAKLNPTIEQTGVGSVTIGGRQWRIRREMLEDFRRHDLPAAISRVEAPTLLFHSRMDATVSFDHALRIMGLIQTAPDTTTPVSLVSLDQADHLLSVPLSDIDFVASTTAAFLTRYAHAGFRPKTR